MSATQEGTAVQRISGIGVSSIGVGLSFHVGQESTFVLVIKGNGGGHGSVGTLSMIGKQFKQRNAEIGKAGTSLLVESANRWLH